MNQAFGSFSIPQTIGAKLMRIHWPVAALLCLLAGIGLSALYSVAGGSFSPWAERHALRFIVTLGLVIAIALTPLRLWLWLAVPTYALALGLLVLVPLVGTEALGAKPDGEPQGICAFVVRRLVARANRPGRERGRRPTQATHRFQRRFD